MPETNPSPAPVVESKSPWKSKTIWLNLVTLASMAVPAVREWLTGNPVEFVSFLAAVGVVLRFVTRGKISVFGTMSNGASNLLVLAITGLGALSVLSLTSCGMVFEGSAYYRDDSGAKGGVRIVPGAPPLPFFRVPVETESGRGAVEIRATK